jgi:hypothetical protein
MPATYNFQVSLRLSRYELEHHEVRLKGGRIVLLVGSSKLGTVQCAEGYN